VLGDVLPVGVSPGNILLWEHSRIIDSHPICTCSEERRSRNFAKPASIVEVVMQQAIVEAREQSAVKNLFNPTFELAGLRGHAR
jgi:hypothetical protein